MKSVSRTCTKCRVCKPLGDFYKRQRSRGGIDTRCKECAIEASAESRRRALERGPTQPAEAKTCKTCGVWRLASEFGRRGDTRDGLQTSCRVCFGKWQRHWNARHRYKITPEEYDEIVSRGCAICGADKRIVLDHDHTTGKARDALCDDCNISLGRMGDDPARLRAAADYIEAHRV